MCFLVHAENTNKTWGFTNEVKFVVVVVVVAVAVVGVNSIAQSVGQPRNTRGFLGQLECCYYNFITLHITNTHSKLHFLKKYILGFDMVTKLIVIL
jgi:hypothetical protein